MAVATFVLGMALGAAAPAESRLVSEQFASLFQAREYHLSGAQGQHGTVVRYRLFVPRDLRPTERCPLLLWLHGAGEGGPENHRNLRYLPMVVKDLEHVEKYRFLLLVPQCPSAAIDWISSLGGQNAKPSEPNDMLTVTYEIVQQTMREQPVDSDRVYLVGICSGGSACWEMAMRHPELFAAVVPTTPGAGDVSRASRLAGIPIWAFQSQYEHGAARAMVTAVKAAGGNIHLTEHRGGHDSWTVAFQICGVMGWMLEQRRGARILWTPPGHRDWKWWHILTVPCGFLVIVLVSWRSEQKRRQRHACACANRAKEAEHNESDDRNVGSSANRTGATNR